MEVHGSPAEETVAAAGWRANGGAQEHAEGAVMVVAAAVAAAVMRRISATGRR